MDTTSSSEQDGKRLTAEFYWERIRHDDTLFTSRASFFLVAQSMLLGAVAILLTNSYPNWKLAVLLVPLGIVSCAIWIWTSLRHLEAVKAFRAGLCQEGSPYAASYPVKLPWPGAHLLMGILLPAVIIITWLLLLLFI